MRVQFTTPCPDDAFELEVKAEVIFGEVGQRKDGARFAEPDEPTVVYFKSVICKALAEASQILEADILQFTDESVRAQLIKAITQNRMQFEIEVANCLSYDLDEYLSQKAIEHASELQDSDDEPDYYNN